MKDENIIKIKKDMLRHHEDIFGNKFALKREYARAFDDPKLQVAMKIKMAVKTVIELFLEKEYNLITDSPEMESLYEDMRAKMWNLFDKIPFDSEFEKVTNYLHYFTQVMRFAASKKLEEDKDFREQTFFAGKFISMPKAKSAIAFDNNIVVDVKFEYLVLFKNEMHAVSFETCSNFMSKTTKNKTRNAYYIAEDCNVEMMGHQIALEQIADEIMPNGVMIHANIFFLKKDFDSKSIVFDDIKKDVDFYKNHSFLELVDMDLFQSFAERREIFEGVSKKKEKSNIACATPYWYSPSCRKCIFGHTYGCEACNECEYTYACSYAASDTNGNTHVEGITFSPMRRKVASIMGEIAEARNMACEGDCSKCDANYICNINRPPSMAEVEEELKKTLRLVASTSQEAVYTALLGPKQHIIVNAGPGTGKTHTLTVTLIKLILEDKIKPEDVLIVTFSTAAADEIRSRILNGLEAAGYEFDEGVELRIMTLNAFCYEVVKKNYQFFGYTNTPSVLEGKDKNEIIIDILKEYEKKHQKIKGAEKSYFKFSANDMFNKGTLLLVSKSFDVIKNEDLINNNEGKEILRSYLNDARIPSNMYTDASLDVIFDLEVKYEVELIKRNKLEFSDQLNFFISLCQAKPDVLDELNIQYLIVDEFQDTSPKQMEAYAIMESGLPFKKQLSVGDVKQAIYGFMGTTPDMMLRYGDIRNVDPSNLAYIDLTENYRSQEKIINFANEYATTYIKAGATPLVSMIKDNGKYEDVHAYQCWSKQEEVEKILDDIQYRHDNNGVSWDKFSIILYDGPEMALYTAMCRERGIPFIARNPEKYVENSRVQAFIGVVKAMFDPKATINLVLYTRLRAILEKEACMKEYEEAIERNASDKELGEIEERISYAERCFEIGSTEQKKAVYDFRDEIVSMNYAPNKKRLLFLQEMADAISEDDEVYESFLEGVFKNPSIASIKDYIDNFLRFGTNDKCRRERDNYVGITITTAHSSKGHEWNYVYVSTSKIYDPTVSGARLEERRRLFYVACTRARLVLTITGQTHAAGNQKDGYIFNKFLFEAYAILGKQALYEDPAKINKLAYKNAEAKEAIKKTREKKNATA